MQPRQYRGNLIPTASPITVLKAQKQRKPAGCCFWDQIRSFCAAALLRVDWLQGRLTQQQESNHWFSLLLPPLDPLFCWGASILVTDTIVLYFYFLTQYTDQNLQCNAGELVKVDTLISLVIFGEKHCVFHIKHYVSCHFLFVCLF